MSIAVFLISFMVLAAILMWLVLPIVAGMLGFGAFTFTVCGMLVYFFIAAFVWHKFGRESDKY